MSETNPVADLPRHKHRKAENLRDLVWKSIRRVCSTAPLKGSVTEESSASVGRPARHLRHALCAVGGFTLLFGWLFVRHVLEGSYVAESDLYEYFLPTFLSRITTWSMFEFGGMPVFADPGDTSFYPLHFLFARVIGSWTGLVVAAPVVAASGTYAYVYSITRSRLAAAISGLAYGLSEAMLERLAHFGIFHTIAWLPLILLCVDRLRGQRPGRWLAIGSLVTACGFLSGNPQTFLYGGYAAALYAVAGGAAARASYRYYFAAIGMAVLGGLLSAVKLLPVLETSLYTARQTVGYGPFVSHSNTPAEMLSILFPMILHEGREAPTYVGLATILLAILAARHVLSQWRVAFWISIVVIALLLGMGDATPLAQFAFDVPFYDKFRVVSRHLYLAALGLAALAGFAVADLQRRAVSRRAVVVASAVAALGLVLGAATLLTWAPDRFEYDSGAFWNSEHWGGPVWVQFAFGAAAVISAFGLTLKGSRRAWAPAALMLLLVVDLLHALPHPIDRRGIELPRLMAEEIKPSVHAVRLAAGLKPKQQRLLAPAGTQVDAVVPAVFARLWQIPIAGGYGPMILADYSHLAMMKANGSVDPMLLADHNAALDLLAVKYVVLHAEEIAGSDTIERHGVQWTSETINLLIGPPECTRAYPRVASFTLPPDVRVSAIALETRLSCAERVTQDSEVGTVKVSSPPGVVHEQILRAGVEVADEELRDPDFRQRAKHGPGTVFATDIGAGSYYTRIDLPSPVAGARLEIRLPGSTGRLQIDRMTVIDEAGHSHPQRMLNVILANADRWREVDRFTTSRTTDRNRDEQHPREEPYVVFENRRALPRAWVVREIVPADGLELDTALHHSFLPDTRPFDPASIALVEPGALPPTKYPDGQTIVLSREIRGNSIRVVVSTVAGGFLVLSENFYPGWRARIDRTVVPVYRTNGALQGVVVPSGRHVVTFEFVSTTLWAGGAISALCLAMVTALLWCGGGSAGRASGRGRQE